MAVQLLSEPWAQAVTEAINGSEEFRQGGGGKQFRLQQVATGAPQREECRYLRRHRQRQRRIRPYEISDPDATLTQHYDRQWRSASRTEPDCRVHARQSRDQRGHGEAPGAAAGARRRPERRGATWTLPTSPTSQLAGSKAHGPPPSALLVCGRVEIVAPGLDPPAGGGAPSIGGGTVEVVIGRCRSQPPACPRAAGRCCGPGSRAALEEAVLASRRGRPCRRKAPPATAGNQAQSGRFPRRSSPTSASVSIMGCPVGVPATTEGGRCAATTWTGWPDR